MRLGIVGCGDAAKAIALASRFVARVRPVVFADTNLDRAVAFARRARGARAVSDWRALADSTEVDAVYVAVPHALHREIAVSLSREGLPVLLEKPLTARLEDGIEMLAELPAGAKLGVNYQFRFDTRADHLERAVRAGRLGRLNYIEVRVPWYREKDYFSNAPWHGVAEVSGGGTLLTQGSHGLDLALWFSGSAPVSAFGSTYQRTFTSTRVEDLAFGVVETQSGVPILISSAMVARPGHPMTVAVYGKAGSAVFTASSPPRLRYRDVRRGVRVPSTPLQPYRSSLAAFRDWIEGGRPYRCSGRDAVPVLSAVDGIYRSARSGQRVDIAVPAG